MDSEEHVLIQTLKHQWTCPITKAPINEPVVTSDGYSYQKNAISIWLQNNNKSPSTNLPLQNKTLFPNLAFKSLIQKLCSQLPVFLEKQEGLKTQIQQLKEQINFLKDQLNHQKQKNNQLIEKQEKQFKTKKIEKLRHQRKFEQINFIRDQKNQYQRQLQQLRSKEQQQNREILQLKDQLKSMTSRFQIASAMYKNCFDLFMKVEQNRDQVFEKLEFSFVSNFIFIGHLLNSIEKAKEYESEKQRARVSQQTIIVEDNEGQSIIEQNFYKRGVITRLQQIIRDMVNESERNPRQYESKYTRIHRFYMRRAMRRNRLRERPSEFTGEQDIYEGLTHSFHGRFMGMQQILELQQLQANNQPVNPQPLNNLNYMVRQRNNIVQRRNDYDAQNLPKNDEDSEFYKQMVSIKWLMSKRPYLEVPDFYDYRICEYHNKKSCYWYGVKLSVLESRIPFIEFLPYSWNHVRWLDLSACNMDDGLWAKFIENAHNFKHLMLLYVRRNKIENVKKAQIEQFKDLIVFDILRNDLSTSTIKEIKEYIAEHPTVKVEYNDTTDPNQNQLDWIEEDDD